MKRRSAHVRPILRHSGFTLVEAMIVVALVGITAAVLSALVLAVGKMQARNDIVKMLTENQQRVTAAINTKAAWLKTEQDASNTEMDCLRKGTSCTAGSYKFALHDTDGSVIFDSHSGTNGFDRNAKPCATYPSQDCPFSYDMTWSPLCPPAPSPCINPQVSVTATLLNSLTAVSDQNTLAINTQNYSTNSIRGPGDRYEPVIMQYVMSNNSGEGVCTLNTWNPRKLNQITYDAGKNVVGSTATTVTLAKGTYKCDVTAPAYEVGGTKIRIYDVTDSLVLATGTGVVAPTNAAVTVSATASFERVFTGDTKIEVDQACTNSNGSYDLGLPVPDAGGSYSNVVYTVLNCVRVY